MKNTNLVNHANLIIGTLEDMRGTAKTLWEDLNLALGEAEENAAIWFEIFSKADAFTYEFIQWMEESELSWEDFNTASEMSIAMGNGADLAYEKWSSFCKEADELEALRSRLFDLLQPDTPYQF